MLEIIIASVYFMLPAYSVNAVPRLAQRFNVMRFLDRPVDFGKSWNGKRIFGSHKTWRGLALAPLCGLAIGVLQSYIWQPDFFPYSGVARYMNIGLLLGSGAILGDLFFAFWKRRIGIQEGNPWIPFDQLNFAVGALGLASVFYVPSMEMIVIILVVSGLGHAAVNQVAYWIGIQKVKR